MYHLLHENDSLQINFFFFLKKRDPFPGPKPIPQEKIKKYERGDRIRNVSQD